MEKKTRNKERVFNIMRIDPDTKVNLKTLINMETIFIIPYNELNIRYNLK
jgi:hypothetical protein